MKHPKEVADYALIFKMLGNEKRLCMMINLCLNGERTVNDLAVCANGSQSYVSQQLGKLKDLNIVTSRKDGLQIYYRITNEKIEKIICSLGLHEICKNNK